MKGLNASVFRVGLTALSMSVCCFASAQLNLYVSTQGKDTWSGMLSTPNSAGTDGPKKTLAGGRDALRKIRAGQTPGGVVSAADVAAAKRTFLGRGATVNIASGVYDATSPVVFDSRDSVSSSRSKITYKATTNRAVVLDAGYTVSNLARPSAAFWVTENRVDPSFRSQVYVADLSGAGDLGRLTFRMPGWNAMWSDVTFRQISNYNQAAELVIDNEAMHLAQWPNEGVVDMNGVNGQPRFHNGHAFITRPGPSNNYSDPNSSNWVYEFEADFRGLKTPETIDANSDIWVRGCMNESKFKEYWEHVTKLDFSGGQSAGLLRFDPVATFYQTNAGRQVSGNGEPGRYTIVNSLYELDSPGEYYLDRLNKRLLVIPPATFVPGVSSVKLTMNQQPIIQANGLRGVTFDGLVLQNGRFMGAYFKNCYNVTFKNGTVQNVGHNGITIDDSYRSNVQSSVITDTGQGGIDVQSGDRATLTPSGNVLSDNVIKRWGRTMRFYTGAVRLDGCGNSMLNNTVADGMGEAVVFHGNDQLISGNHFSHVSYDSGDSGVTVTGHDVSDHGNVVSNNYFEEVRSLPYSRWPVTALFVDGAGGGTSFDNNIVVGADKAVNILATCDINVRNNVFMNVSGYAVRASAAPFAPGGDYITRANQMPWRGSLWSTRYPNLAEWLTTLIPAPRHYNISNNIYVNCGIGLADKASWGKVFAVGGVNKYNVDQASSPFVDANGGNFALRADKTSLVPGWTPLSTDSAGSRTIPDGTGSEF
ncbi:MAG: right-handed parallel beta-helix repeat-containing protein [Fimbriimonadaceae bacterium]|nr:right-handed parallel beta-helix repeat-containing protein [Fimbriimonadaceae bacterium]